MKTGSQILAETSAMIAAIHNRPEMYVGSKSKPGAANAFEGMMWFAHFLWASIQSRQAEFQNTSDSVREKHNCSCLGFADAFRHDNPQAGETAAFEHVRKCWAEIDSLLGIDISKEAVNA